MDGGYEWRIAERSEFLIVSAQAASLRFSDELETLNMKHHFVLGESHLTLSEVSVREQGQRRFKQTRKESRRPPLAQDRLHINCKRVSKIV